MHRIIFIQYTNPAAYPPLEHSSHILAEEGWEILFLGTGSLGANELVLPKHARIHEKKLPFSPAGWRQKIHYLKYIVWCLYWSLKWKPDWVYASDPLSCPVAIFLTLLPVGRVIYHEHDSPQTSDASSFQRIILFSRSLLARRAYRCVLPNRQRAVKFDSEVKASVQSLVVWNCPKIAEVGLAKKAREGAEVKVLYHGSIVPSRLPKTVIQALASISGKVKLQVVGYETVGSKGYVSELQNLARYYGIEHRVEFLGAIPERKELLEICKGSDVGLALMPIQTDDFNQHHMVGASNKPFDYMACGLALIVSDLPDWTSMFVEPGYGMACNPDKSQNVAEVLEFLSSHPEKMLEMGLKGREKILGEWNYNRQFQAVIDHMSMIQ